ncbi:MAG TPA: hypothetical protein VFQ45_18125 [Longimicrobium sp.]|nr:hypothetical protein [Longimicrobium sp.]
MPPVMTALFIAAYALAGILLLVAMWGVGSVVHERYWLGHVDAFKPERRLGPADRRVRSGA